MTNVMIESHFLPDEPIDAKQVWLDSEFDADKEYVWIMYDWIKKKMIKLRNKKISVWCLFCLGLTQAKRGGTGAKSFGTGAKPFGTGAKPIATTNETNWNKDEINWNKNEYHWKTVYYSQASRTDDLSFIIVRRIALMTWCLLLLVLQHWWLAFCTVNSLHSMDIKTWCKEIFPNNQ